MGYKVRAIPGTNVGGKIRGGGSESVEWARNGPFDMTRDATFITPGMPLTSYLAGGAVYTSTPLLPTTISEDTQSQILAKGQRALGGTIPLSPSVNLLTSAGELAKDGFPNPADLIRWKKGVWSLLQQGARNYVAFQFAWLPLKREIEAWLHQVQKFDSIVNEAKKTSGNSRIKVGFTFPVDADSSASVGNINAYIWSSGTSTGNLAAGGAWKSITKRVWFEATYQHLWPAKPETDAAISDYAQKARRGLGIGLTPETVWELAPWSFAVDWVLNVDDALSAVSATLNDGLVMRDGFVMSHWRREATQAASGPHMSGSGNIARFTPTKTQRLVERKLRFPAVPYFGFGPTASLSVKQLSILAALGISRA